jgi:D-3-phosphoglycerate dehydrogenase
MPTFSDLRVLIADDIATAGVERLRAVAQVDVDAEITAAQLLARIHGYHALVVRSRTKVDSALLAAAAQLRVVGRAGVGVDNVDVEAAAARSVIVVNSPLAATTAVAELTLALMLAVARQVPLADAAMKQGEWPKKKLQGAELEGKTLGLIGFGRIGREVARRAQVFGMRIVAYNIIPIDPASVAHLATLLGLQQVLAASDYISLHVPVTNATRNIIDAAALASCKPGVRIVCTARGGLIDEAALLSALESGRVAAAGLDVFATEPPGASALVRHPHVVAMPHVGAQTAEAQERAGVDIGDEVAAALTGKSLRWRVLPDPTG